MESGVDRASDLLGLSPRELKDLMHQLLPKMDFPIVNEESREGGASYTCQGAKVLATTGLVTPEVLQPLALAEDRAICVSTGGFTDDARAYGSEFGLQLYDAGDLAGLASEHGLWEAAAPSEQPPSRFLPSIETLESMMNEAAASFVAGRYDEAAALYAQATELKPHYDLAWALRGVCRQRMGDPEAAMELLQHALDISVENPDVWFYLASLLYEMGRHDEELEAYDQAVKLRPDFAEAWMNKGATLHEMGRYEDAVKCFEAASRAGVENAGALANLGAALIRLERYDEALEALEAAVEADPKAVDAIQHLAAVLQRLGRHEEAIRNFATVLKDRPNLAALWFAKGESHLELREKEAVECFRKALKIDPEFSPALEGLERSKKIPLRARPPEPPASESLEAARAALSSGDVDAATRAYDEAARESPEDPEVWFEKGMTLALAGSLEGALEAFTRAVDLKEGDLRFLLSRMNVLSQLGRHEEALEDSSVALRAGATGMEIWLRRGETFMALGMPREAAQCFKVVLDEDDTLAYVWSSRGQALAEAGDVEGAKESLEKALALDPELADARERSESLGGAAVGDALEYLAAIPGVPRATAEALVAAGFTTVARLAASDEAELCAVRGVGPATARKILARLEEAGGTA